MGISRFRPKKIPVYEVGDIGPGGGIIRATPTSANNNTGKYYEAANVPATYPSNVAVPGEATIPYGYLGDDSISSINSKSGFLNSLKIYSRYGDTYTYAVRSCLKYDNPKKDWYLPSLYELYNLVNPIPGQYYGGYHSTSSMEDTPRYEYSSNLQLPSPDNPPIVYKIIGIDNNNQKIWIAAARRNGVGVVYRVTDMNGGPTEISLSPMTYARCVAYGNGMLIVAGSVSSNTGTDMMKSTDLGITWTSARTNAGDMSLFEEIKFANGYFIAIGRLLGAGVQKIWKSTDGTTWTQCTTSIPNGYTIRDLIYNDGKWIVIGQGGMLVTSTDDGATWTTSFPASLLTDNLYSINYGDGKIVIGGGYLYVSTDNGVTWTTVDYSYLDYFGTAILKYNDYTKKWYLVVNDDSDGYIYESSDLTGFTKVKYYNGSPVEYLKKGSISGYGPTGLYVDREYIAFCWDGGFRRYRKGANFYYVENLVEQSPNASDPTVSTAKYYVPIRSFYPHGV